MASTAAPARILQDFCLPTPVNQHKVAPGRTLEIETGEGLFRVFVCGSQGVGKTAFIARYCQARFPKWYDPIEVDYHSVETIAHHKCLFEFTEFDADDDDELGNSAANNAYPEGLKDMDVLILIYDVGSRSSFAQVAASYRGITALRGQTGLPVAVVANKFDMFQDSREVTQSEGMELAETIGAAFAQCSAKEGDGVGDVVRQLMKSAVDRRLKDLENKDRREMNARKEQEMVKQTRVKRSMSGRIMSRLSWRSSNN